MTLLDYPGLVACTVFTKGCNFCCPFCHNAALLQGNNTPLDTQEVLRYIRERSGVIDGVVISGGEPTLQDGLEDFLREIRREGLRVKIDTNGSRPDTLAYLVENRLVNYVAMDIKNAPELYPVTCGAVDLSAVEESRDILLKGSIPYEFRTTVVKGLHTRESLMGAAHFIEGARQYFLQQYREVPGADGLSAFTDGEMRDLLLCVRTVIPSAELRGVSNGK